MELWRHPEGLIDVARLGSEDRVGDALEQLLDPWAERLPPDTAAPLLVKPNLNNDLPGVTGNSTDLRVLAVLLAWLHARGYSDVTVADGPNVGVHRRGIDVFQRLRVDRLAACYGARTLDLNHDEGVELRLASGMIRVARAVVEARAVINLPSVKTHAEAVYSSCVKNLIGTVCGEQKRSMHDDLAANLVALATRLPTQLQLVDGLIAMEGNGPGDGDPRPLGLLAVGADPLIVDGVVSRLLGFGEDEIPYLALARQRGQLDPTSLPPGAPAFPPLVKAPPRGLLARLSDLRILRPVKVLARPITGRPAVARMAYRLGVIQDVYLTGEVRADARRLTGVDAARCVGCDACVRACPVELPFPAIASGGGDPRCLGCLYCFWACPYGAIELLGDPGPLKRALQRYRPNHRSS